MSYTKVFALVALAASAAMAQGTIYCASDDMRRHYCAADTRGGVNIARQRSDASCIAGRTWGYDGRGIWVDRGCRADFVLSSYNAGGYGPYVQRSRRRTLLRRQQRTVLRERWIRQWRIQQWWIRQLRRSVSRITCEQQRYAPALLLCQYQRRRATDSPAQPGGMHRRQDLGL